jgi:hypothetical protein
MPVSLSQCQFAGCGAPAAILTIGPEPAHQEGILVFDSEFERNLFELRQAKLKEIEKLGQAA